MAEVYGLEISTNVMEFAYEKKFPSVLTLGELKRKLELVVGAVSELIKIELRDSDGKFVASLTDDNRSLKELGVKDGT
uniref:Ubiquitin-like domain-containing protein n=1 Tax=Heterorhabditis bacteriophora TaxID=37862 RepID=A0A1I7XIY1_HETBA